MNVARKTFYANFIAENSTDQRKLFRAAKKLLSKKEVPSFPDYSDKSVLANDIGQFFIQKIETIRSNIEAIENSCTMDTVSEDHKVDSETSLSAFRPLTEARALFTNLSRSLLRSLVNLIPYLHRSWSPALIFFFLS